MHRVFIAAVTMLLAITAMGCGKSQTVKDSWKFTTRQYRTYLNTPASVDLEDKGNREAYELALGEAVLSMDMELQRLMRAMENSDHNPDQNWVMGMMSRFPWLSGVALADGTGAVVAQYPEMFAKTFDITPLLAPDPKQRLGELRAYAKPDDTGAEIYLANPVFGGDEMRGLIVAHFDIRTLISMGKDPGAFVVATPAGVIWPGNFGQGSAISTADWDKILKSKSSGLVGTKGAEFFWTTRYFGNLPLVYAIPVSAAPSEVVPEALASGTPVMGESQPGGVSESPISNGAASSSSAGATPEPPVEDGPPSAGGL